MIKFILEWLLGTVGGFLVIFLGALVYRCLSIVFLVAVPDPYAQTAMAAGAVIFGLGMAIKERLDE